MAVTNTTPGPNYNPEIDHTTSILPASNLPFTTVTDQASWLTDGGSLGDYDDILMLTVRNEHEPFVGRVPKTDGTPDAVRRLSSELVAPFPEWEPTTIESPLAEVVWFAVENPDEDNNADGFFGEPGMRTIYRRALLIAPWLNPYRTTDQRRDDRRHVSLDDGDSFTAQPGLLRILQRLTMAHRRRCAQAIACLIAFQERYDISARLEWDPLMGSDGRWKIVANTLGDLTKRENRYEHHWLRLRRFGDAGADANLSVSLSRRSAVDIRSTNVAFVHDPEVAADSERHRASLSGANLMSNGVDVHASTILVNDDDGAATSRPAVCVCRTQNSGTRQRRGRCSTTKARSCA